MQLTTRSYGLKCFWRSLVICWLFPFVVFTIVPEHGGRFLSSGMLLWGMRRPCAYILLALYLKLCQCGILVAQHFSWFPSLPLLSWFRVSLSFPGFFFFFLVSGLCAFYLHWASGFSVTGAIAGVAGCGGGLWLGCRLVGLWVFFRLGV